MKSGLLVVPIHEVEPTKVHCFYANHILPSIVIPYYDQELLHCKRTGEIPAILGRGIFLTTVESKGFHTNIDFSLWSDCQETKRQIGRTQISQASDHLDRAILLEPQYVVRL